MFQNCRSIVEWLYSTVSEHAVMNVVVTPIIPVVTLTPATAVSVQLESMRLRASHIVCALNHI